MKIDNWEKDVGREVQTMSQTVYLDVGCAEEDEQICFWPRGGGWKKEFTSVCRCVPVHVVIYLFGTQACTG